MTGVWLISYITLWILFLILAVVLLLTVRSLSVVVEQLQALHAPSESPSITVPVGENLPDVELLARDQTAYSIHSFRGVDTAVVVVSPGCGPCRDVLAKISQHAASADPLQLRVARTLLICVGDMNEVAQDLAQSQFSSTIPLLFDPEQKVMSVWGIHGTPTIIVVNPDFEVVRAATGFGSNHA